MFQILKKLKRSWKSMIIIITLLIVQAMAELALPDYTSKIVNVGIQQGGIESCVPEVMREKTLDDAMLAIKEKDFVLSKYKLISKDSLSQKDYEEYLEKYPELKNENLYVLDEKISKEDEEKLAENLAKPLIMLYFVNTSGQQEMMKGYVLSLMPKEVVPSLKDKSLIEIVKGMPEEKSQKLIELFGDAIDEKTAGMLEQSAIVAVKAEYESVRS